MLGTFRSLQILFCNSALSSKSLDYQILINWLNLYWHSPFTYQLYQSVVLRFLMWLSYNQLTLQTISRIHILDYHRFLQNIPSSLIGVKLSIFNANWKPFNKQLSNNTITRHLTIINSFMLHLHNISYTKNNIFFRKIKQNNVTNYNDINDKCLTTKEINIIMRHVYALPQKSIEQKIYKTRLILLLKLLLYTGCRRTEIATLKSSDIVMRHRKLWFKVFGKGSKIGYVPLNPSIFRLINKYRTLCGLSDLLHQLGTEHNIPLLMMQTRPLDMIKPINAQWVYNTIKSLLATVSQTVEDPIIKNKLQKTTPHWFRHTCATMQADKGIDIRYIKENLRHSSIRTTMLYVHTDRDRQYYETVTKFGLGPVNKCKKG